MFFSDYEEEKKDVDKKGAFTILPSSSSSADKIRFMFYKLAYINQWFSIDGSRATTFGLPEPVSLYYMCH